MSRSPTSLILLAVLLGGCTAGNLDGGTRLALGQGELTMPVRDMVSRRFLTVVRQQYDFSCGSAALATLLHYHYGDPHTEQTAFLGMWRDGDRAQIRRLGFSLLDMKRYLAARGIAADGYRVTLDQIAKARTPGIALIDTNGYKHFVVVKGLEDGRILLGDPALGLRHVPAEDFAKMWNGILFAVNGRTQLAKASFGREAEWSLVPRGRVLAAMEPVSQQALALTRPLPGEL
jgi:predicted double-glycine peptidase